MKKIDRQALELKYPDLHRVVVELQKNHVKIDDDQAWLTAGALLAYTGIASIPKQIVKAADKNPHDYPKVVGQINNVLRGKEQCTPEHHNLLALLKNIEYLTDYPAPGLDPTRMMDHYENIDEHYKANNVLLMGEVGSVCRHRPAPGMYQKKYRIHITGGLKNISFLNPAQQELIYAPETPYLVVGRRTGKIKNKKGNQAHEHIYLQYAPQSRAQGINLCQIRG
jgi:hypothetical protein